MRLLLTRIYANKQIINACLKLKCVWLIRKDLQQQMMYLLSDYNKIFEVDFISKCHAIYAIQIIYTRKKNALSICSHMPILKCDKRNCILKCLSSINILKHIFQ